MEEKLNEVEARILGVLIEKQMATPDYYPLTLNALVNACNQKTNREPVMDLSEEDVEEALGALRHRRLVWQVKAQGSRALKYEQNLEQIAEFSKSEQAILCALLLRGPQTAGELRTRTTRLIEFHALPAVEHTLQNLMEHEKGPFVVRLERRPGQKENRFAHLFFEPDESDGVYAPVERIEMPEDPEAADTRPGGNERLEALEGKVEELAMELAELKERFLEFMKQFE